MSETSLDVCLFCTVQISPDFIRNLENFGWDVWCSTIFYSSLNCFSFQNWKVGWKVTPFRFESATWNMESPGSCGDAAPEIAVWNGAENPSGIWTPEAYVEISSGTRGRMYDPITATQKKREKSGFLCRRLTSNENDHPCLSGKKSVNKIIIWEGNVRKQMKTVWYRQDDE